MLRARMHASLGFNYGSGFKKGMRVPGQMLAILSLSLLLSLLPDVFLTITDVISNHPMIPIIIIVRTVAAVCGACSLSLSLYLSLIPPSLPFSSLSPLPICPCPPNPLSLSLHVVLCMCVVNLGRFVFLVAAAPSLPAPCPPPSPSSLPLSLPPSPSLSLCPPLHSSLSPSLSRHTDAPVCSYNACILCFRATSSGLFLLCGRSLRGVACR